MIKNIVALNSLERGMRRAESYADWESLADRHDELSGAAAWKMREDCDLYDARQIRRRLKVLQNSVEANDAEETLFALNEGIHGNMGGMGKSKLYRKSKRGTKKLINDYVETVTQALMQVKDAGETEIPLDEKLDFFRRASHCYGRSALSLSGGGGFIYFHHGVVDTFIEHDLLPNVISGSSAGAWMAGQIGTRTDEELRGYFQTKRYDYSPTKSVLKLVGQMGGRGRADAENEISDAVDSIVDNMTFQEAFEHTGRYINIPIAPVERHQTSRLMNAITSPNVTVRSAIKASSSIPGLLDPVELEAKDSHGRMKPYLRSRRWVDGSFAEDLPFKRMSRLFGVNHNIVSMINPIAVPFLQEQSRLTGGALGKSMRRVLRVGAKEYLKNARRVISPVTLGAFDSVLGAAYQLIDQEYVGDINLMVDKRLMKMRYASFSFRNEKEIQQLVASGQRAVWSKLDQIRNAVQISHVIDSILESMDQKVVNQAHTLHKPHMTL